MPFQGISDAFKRSGRFFNEPVKHGSDVPLQSCFKSPVPRQKTAIQKIRLFVLIVTACVSVRLIFLFSITQLDLESRFQRKVFFKGPGSLLVA